MKEGEGGGLMCMCVSMFQTHTTYVDDIMYACQTFFHC